MVGKQRNGRKVIFVLYSLIFLVTLLSTQCDERTPVVELPPLEIRGFVIVDATGRLVDIDNLRPGEQIYITAEVTSDLSSTFIWQGGSGVILEGNGTETIFYRVPDVPGEDRIEFVVQQGSQRVNEPITINVVTPPSTLTPTNTPTPVLPNPPSRTPTPTPTDTSLPTNTPMSTPTHTVTHTPTPMPKIHFIDKDINFRKGPGTNYPIIGFLSVGTEVEILGRNNAGDWFFVSLETSSKGWISDLAFRELIVLADVPVQTPPPTPTFTPIPTPVSAPILIAPENAAEFVETRPDLIWIWDGDIIQDDNFYFEVKTWLNDKKDPIDVAWVRYPCYRYDEVIEGVEDQVWEFRWNVIVVKGIPGEPKSWSPVEPCGQWSTVPVWDPGLITQTVAISEISEKRLIKVIIGPSATLGVPPGGEDDDDDNGGPGRD